METYQRRLAKGVIPVYIDPNDRHRRLLERRDVIKLVRIQVAERSEETAP